MTTLYWQIAPELTQLRHQAERMLEDRGQTPAEPPTWKPSAELRDLGDRYELQLQLPGVDVSSLDIQASRDRITVKGDRPATQAQLIHSEFRTGSFERAIRLPEALQHQAVSADYNHGLLTLNLPKLTAAPDYRVRVMVNATATANVAEKKSGAAEPEMATAAESTTLHLPETEGVAVAEVEDLWAEPA